MMRQLIKILLVIELVIPLQGLSIPTAKPIECTLKKPLDVHSRSSNAAVSVDNTGNYPSVQSSEVLTDDGQVVNVTVCAKPSDFCYSLWKINEDLSYDIISQGCWESSGSLDCQTTQCISSGKASTLIHKSHFCCCHGSMCNRDIIVANSTENYEDYPPDSSVVTVSNGAPYNFSSNAVLMIAIFGCSVIILAVVFVLWICPSVRQTLTKKSFKHLNQENSDQPLLSDPSFESLRLVDLVGRGRYGTVWKASLDDKQVAVKVFQPSSRSFFNNERIVYSLPQMSHTNIISFIGYLESASATGHLESKLILEYAPYGCLQEYLRHNTIDFETMVKMGSSVSSGLAHLHTDFQRDGQSFSIVHRDLNSRNVLVKSDLTCCLCDFGFAMQVSGAHYAFNGEQQHAETSSLSDVGTLRYMAPEVLEGAVNLRECESSLKQVDVYALSLVLWEIAWRCRDLYPCREANPYCLPLEDSIGPHPTLEQMKIYVCRYKTRPTILDVWSDSNPSIRLLKDTLNDAWDSDAEARLTSRCVEERWSELKLVWDREKAKRGLSPNLRSNATRLFENPKNDANLSSIRPDEPRDSTVSLQKNREVWTQLVPLQPHQGRNLCLERNTMPINEDVSIDGNTLVERSAKNESQVSQRTAPSENVQFINTEPAEMVRIAQPIPYVQNAVRGSDQPIVETSENLSLGQLLSDFFRGQKNKRVDLINERKSKLNNQERETSETEEQELHVVGKQGQGLISFSNDLSESDSRKQNLF